MSQQPGRFITVEGIEGVGKTTNIEFVRGVLEQAGIDVVITREPGGTALGEDIRGLLLGHKHDGMSFDTELLLMFAARAEHLASVVKPALEAGKWVLCDRFTDATYAYQGGGRGIDKQRIATLEDWVQGALRPDLTLLLDVSVATGLKRADGRGQGRDRFEQEQVMFFEKVRQCYLAMASNNVIRYRVIDAEQSLDDVQACLQETVNQFILQHS